MIVSVEPLNLPDIDRRYLRQHFAVGLIDPGHWRFAFGSAPDVRFIDVTLAGLPGKIADADAHSLERTAYQIVAIPLPVTLAPIPPSHLVEAPVQAVGG